MKLKLVGSLLLLIVWVEVTAQYSESINSDRPGQAITAMTVGKNIFQWQSGLEYNKVSFKSRNYRIWRNEQVVRIGLTEQFEVGVKLTPFIQNSATGRKTLDLSYVTINNRYNIAKGSGNKPTIGIESSFSIPTEFQNTSILPRFTLITNGSFYKSIKLATNSGVSWGNGTSLAAFFYILNFNAALNDKWGTFIEHYATIGSGSFQPNFDAGFSYLSNANLQYDLSFGYNKINIQNSTELFISAGISYRFKIKNPSTLNPITDE